MNDSEGAALLAAINENLNDLAPRLIYSDWLEENGRDVEALLWRSVRMASPLFDFFSSISYPAGCGDGSGFKSSHCDGVCGYGDGVGDDNGYDRRDGSPIERAGTGTGSGYGWGSGFFGLGYERPEIEWIWPAIGHGDGRDEVYESGNGNGALANGYQTLEIQKASIDSFQEITEGKPVIGKKMLIWCGRGFAWIGHVDEMYAPGCYKLSNAGMLCRTGPDSWMAVASGTARDNYVYRHAPDGIVYTGPELHGAVEWKGELPGRDMR